MFEVSGRVLVICVCYRMVVSVIYLCGGKAVLVVREREFRCLSILSFGMYYGYDVLLVIVSFLVKFRFKGWRNIFYYDRGSC